MPDAAAAFDFLLQTRERSRVKRADNNSVQVAVEGRARVVLERMAPDVDAGRFPIKRVIGETVEVELDAFTDGHDRIACVLLYRHEREADWHELAMTALPNDRWRAQFTVTELGRYRYTASAWVDHYASWRHDLERRPIDDPDLPTTFEIGAALIDTTAQQAHADDKKKLLALAAALRSTSALAEKRAAALADDSARLVQRYDARRFATRYERELAVVVDRERARFGAWYEFFPRSCDADKHGRFADCEPRLAYAAALGFDIVYLPPIHPVGHSFRKGPNNSLTPAADDVGSVWAIGSAEGGHKAVHPELGTLEDFRRFVAQTRTHGMEVALDIAFQCSPDHPYVKEHPEWFRRRPDGSIQYAENPPKKYQDIYAFDFECEAWQSLWLELKSVVDFWIAHDVHVFRIDNPHTKAFAFWEWLIGEVKREHPEIIFLSEAFTRPKVMHRLAKLGFTQSYTYFTWRNTKSELTEYFTELTAKAGHEYFRPNVWPNTPDILNEYLQFGGRPAFVIRLVLAATLAASYGIYGPAFELAEAQAREPGSEEYRDSEKYQLRQWDLERQDSLRDLIALVNRIRRDNPALQIDRGLRFHPIDNDKLLCYSKENGDNAILVVVNLDPHHRQSGRVDLPLAHFGIKDGEPYQMHDLLSSARFLWYGARNYVELDPAVTPAHIFRLRRKIHREHDFDYYL
jgi:starch synthase (maltosyl-transferring)